MAMYSSARHAVRRSLAASLGADLRQATPVQPASRRLPHRQLLLLHLFSSAASSGSNNNEASSKHDEVHDTPSRPVLSEDVEKLYERHEEKRMELIRLLGEAFDTCEPAHRDRVMEKYHEVEQLCQDIERLNNCQQSHNSDSCGTGSKKSINVGRLTFAAASSIFLGLALSELHYMQ